MKKVFVGMSGGVDSSVSAALLKEAGYDVTGVFLKVWHPDFLRCTWIDDRREAMRAAAHLGIPFLELNLEEEYKRDIVDYMIEEYRGGRVPNPDVMCNKRIKFGAFFEKARAMGADFIATGHYAQHVEDAGMHKLLAGVDPGKDQSYFLWTLSQNELPHLLFPVGHLLKKDEVRELARKFDLPNAERKDSQGLCFIGKVDMKDFLKHYIPPQSGDVLNEAGEVIGIHEGAFYYTIGQRHGFTVTKKGPNDPIRYVIAKNLEKNTITVSDALVQEERAVTTIELKDVHFISGITPDVNKKYGMRLRYRQPLSPCTLSLSGESYVLTCDEPQKAVAPGQSVVLYDGNECLGGGIII